MFHDTRKRMSQHWFSAAPVLDTELFYSVRTSRSSNIPAQEPSRNGKSHRAVGDSP
jgi:hypothetical protein